MAGGLGVLDFVASSIDCSGGSRAVTVRLSDSSMM